MSSITTLLPTSVALSIDSSIGYILADIPLFCEGIMGIGIFTFLFLVKRVRLLSIFLYGSAFLAFVAATLDLGQVLARGPKKTENDISLNTIWSIIYAREVFLALSFGFLDLFFWKLVACCPIQEIEYSETIKNRKGRKQLHSANWNRWGLIGMILKWASLAASLSLPLLQILWRLLPNQRQYGTIYIAENTVETTLAAVFILKLALNISISPNEWWYAFQSYVVPVVALSIEIGLGVGNFITFAFTETTLGRLLRGVEVYLLILHNLHTAFRVYGHILQDPENTIIHSKSNEEKLRVGAILPIASPDSGPRAQYPLNAELNVTRQIDRRTRTSKLSWILPRKTSPDTVEGAQSQTWESEAKAVLSPIAPTDNDRRSENEQRSGMLGDQQQLSSFLVLGSPTDVLSPKILHSSEISPDTTKQGTTEPQTGNNSTYQSDANNGKRGDLAEDFKLPISGSSSTASQQRSSIDEILRQQTELDKSIARLRMISEADIAVSAPPKSRNTFNSNKTESTSNRSDFSLSVFPDPPVVPKDKLIPNYSADVGISTTEASAESSIVISPDESSPQDEITDNVSSSPSQYDVRSLIGDLTFPSTEDSRTKPSNEHDEALIASSATIGAAHILRPMILPSRIASPQNKDLVGGPSEPMRGAEKLGLPSQSLRPLLLGKPIAVVPSLPATMVPLAQRRQRAGTISSNTRRPVISVPLLNEEKTEAAPDAFERPRPPPLRLRT